MADPDSEDAPEYKQYEIPPEEAAEFLRGEMQDEETNDAAQEDELAVDGYSELPIEQQWDEPEEPVEEAGYAEPVYTYEEVQPAEEMTEVEEIYQEGVQENTVVEIEPGYQPYEPLMDVTSQAELPENPDDASPQDQSMEISAGPYQQYQPQEDGSSASYQEVQQEESTPGSLIEDQPQPLANIFESYQEYQSLGQSEQASQEFQSLDSTEEAVLEYQPLEEAALVDRSYPPDEAGMDFYPSYSQFDEGTTSRGEQQPELPAYEYPVERVQAPASDPVPGEVSTITFEQQDEPPAAARKIALILSGGGARGAFQVGAEMYARQVKGYHWDIIAGISVGAMNGAMLAMHRYERLQELWNNISDRSVYTGGFNVASVIKLLFGAQSFYGYEPLKKMMAREFESGRVIDDLHVGAVSLITGEYMQFTKEFLELPDAILASAAIPVAWPPVDISAEHRSMVDGGVRNNSPVGDVLDLEPDEIVIINCSTENPAPLTQAPKNVVEIGMRALDIMQNEIFINDVKEFLRINALVKEAQDQGFVLHHPKTGRPLKYYPYVLIEPDYDLGPTLDFSQLSVQASLKAGVRRAREVMGRP